MIALIRAQFRALASHAEAKLSAAFGRPARPLPLVAGLAGDVLRTRRELIAENALLRQQLIIVSRKVKRPPCRPYERGLLVLLSRQVPPCVTLCCWSNPRPF